MEFILHFNKVTIENLVKVIDIWILWFQGFHSENELPWVNRECINAWKKLNEDDFDFRVNFLDEAELYKKQLDDAITKADNGFRPTFAMMRHAAVYENQEYREEAIRAIQTVLGQFENLFRNMGDVHNGFPRVIPLDELQGREQYKPSMLEENLLFGSPDIVIKKLKKYKELGVDEFIYYASMGMDMGAQKRSMKLFCDEVIPEFQ